jgi:integrase
LIAAPNTSVTDTPTTHAAETPPPQRRRRRTAATAALLARTTALAQPSATAESLIVGDLLTPRAQDIQTTADTLLRQYFEHRSQQQGPARTQRPLSQESKRIYAGMWSLFAQFCVAYNVDPRQVGAGPLRSFVDSRSTRQASATSSSPDARATAVYRWRLLRLIHAVWRVHAERTGEPLCTAAEQLLASDPYDKVNLPDRRGAPLTLREPEVARLVATCTLTLREGHPQAPSTWADVRDNTAVLLQLGHGLAPREIRCLTLDDLQIEDGWPARLWVKRAKRRREIVLSAEMRKVLAYWLSVRAAMQLPADCKWLFVATQTAKPWSETALQDGVHNVFERALIDRPIVGAGYLLRHTFVLRSLKVRGWSAQRVADELGLKDVAKIERLYRGLALT